MGLQVKSERPNIVVVGGSYVGLKAVEFLANAFHESHQIVLIEKNSHFQHLFAFPRFAVLPGYEHLAFVPYTNAFHGSPPNSVTHIRGRVKSVLPGRIVFTETGLTTTEAENSVPREQSIDYEYLVIATGTKLPPPGTLQVEGKVDGIEYFRQHQKKVADAQNIVVVGGGAVGVQMVTDIKEVHPNKSVTLIHSRDHLMNAFHPRIHSIIMERAQELGIAVILGDRVKVPLGGFPTNGQEFEVETMSGKKIKADFAILCTGQTPLSESLISLSPEVISPTTHRVLVKPTLQLADSAYPTIFAVGDVAETGGPKQARPAFKQVEIATENIKRLEAAKKEGKDLGVLESELETYRPDPAGIHLSLGLARNIKFRNPGSPSEEPTFEIKDDGSPDVRTKKLWKMRAPGITDYFS